MRILISNDDGLNSEGLEILQQFAHSISDDVWTVVPDSQRSATGHGITIFNPLRLTKVKEKTYISNGTPADCVILAIHHLLKEKKPTWVFSGINQGENIGDDVVYSGTIAVAREAAIHGFRSIAFSQSYNQHYGLNFSYSREYVKDAFESVAQLDYQDTLYNINFPPYREKEPIKGIKFVPQGMKFRKDILEKKLDPREKEYFWLNVFVDHFESNEDEIKDDIEAIANNYISITPLVTNFTNFDKLKKIN